MISGAGVVCALGAGCEALASALFRGEDGLRPITRFDVSAFQTRIAGLCPDLEGMAPDGLPSAIALGAMAAKEAWSHAGLGLRDVPPERVAVVVGTCFGEHFFGFGELATGIARAVGAKGPCFTVSTACSSSTTAIGLGRDLIEEGVVDVVLAGGADVITREVFAGFHALGALSVDKCAPFGEPAGTTLGEGAGFFALEARERAETRRVEPLGFVLGYDLTADAHHETAPDPSGNGVARAIRGALEDAALEPASIDLVSAHGTGTQSNDVAEFLALQTALGDVALRLPISATKSFIGHTQGAAGVIELCAALLCARRGAVPPTLRAHPPRRGAPPDPVADPVPRPARVDTVLKLSAAFGGANSALVVGRTARAPRLLPERRPVSVLGLSAVGPHGLDVAALEACAARNAVLEGPAAPFDLGRVVRSAPSREIDPSGQLVSAAAALALADARLPVRGATRERVGIFTGTSRMPARSGHDCRKSIEVRGITGVAAGPFSRMVLNAPAGTAARLLSLKGPLLVVSGGPGSGLLALLRAAEHLSVRPRVEALVAGGHDELPVGPGDVTAEGSAMAVLSCGGGFDSGVRLMGWGLAGAGPEGLRSAVAQALLGVPEVDGVFASSSCAAEALRGGVADPARLPLGMTDVDALIGGAVSSASAFAFVLAAAAVRRGAARRLLVVSSGFAVSCAALVVSAAEESHGR